MAMDRIFSDDSVKRFRTTSAPTPRRRHLSCVASLVQRGRGYPELRRRRA